ncbi:hypothetical protein E1292_00780 [Nonomuraea deserti]|uniref:Uncharacterized protein n=1 Tax=Nonomuraea deserti TaxID=1848322 RepID=A0A4R4WAC9_9ACTN|nr:hypothetical protein [Nonomuraea deserti]TDD12824.1 hypothetical protein E1292_00780 [Nonomuraea deserti]
MSPCPHTPACPPPICLPSSLRTPSTPAATPEPTQPPGTSSGSHDGYETSAKYVRKFAGTMDASATGVDTVKEATPRFEGWDLVPLAGVPIVGLMFVNRFNTITDTWKDSAGILSEVLRTDSGKVSRAADNYVAAERAGTVK